MTLLSVPEAAAMIIFGEIEILWKREERGFGGCL
jgi:hypothetical protein